MTPEGKKIWDSKAGGDLMAAMLGGVPLTDADKKTLEALKQTSLKPDTTPDSSLKDTTSKT